MKCFLQSIIAVIFVMTACKNPPKADKAETSEPQKVKEKTAKGADYKADLQKTNVQWTAATPVRRQHGTFLLKEGVIIVKDTSIEGGHLIIDTNSLTAFDEDGSANSKLQNHLKSPDFFDVEKFGTASFEITSVRSGIKNDKDLVMKDATHTITGNLKIKDSTKSISFPAKISIAGSTMIADANFNIDRTQWGMNYGNDKSKGVKYIKPEINLKVHLEANK
jgi:polyisoprenoid-binding protein YceI